MPKTIAQDRIHRARLKCDRQPLATNVIWLVIALATSLPSTFQAAVGPVEQAVSTAAVITSRGPHHRIWTRSSVVTGLDGRARTNASSYVELGSGMHRWSAESNQWIDAEAVIEIEGNTAVARKGAHQVTFAANANTPGAIDLVTPDGKRLRSHVLGIALFNDANNRSEMIGSLKDSPGELHPPNIVLYQDAFDGVKADLRYTYRLGSFEQDVILKENLELPDGFDPDTTRLEVWTEFIEYPGALLIQNDRVGMTDDTLDFGAMQTGAGGAFALGDESSPSRAALVAKRWLTAEGRTFLVEAVRFNSVKGDLENLPAQGQAALKARNANAQLAAAAPPRLDYRPFPTAPQARFSKPGEQFRTATIPTSSLLGGVRGAVTNAALNSKPSTLNPAQQGFVIDYNLYASLTNFTFQCDTTYYASNTVNFYGTTTFEGGTVVKYAKTNTAQLTINGSVLWKTAQYRPAIFTAKDDSTVGDDIGSGTPSGYYGGTYLSFSYNAPVTNTGVRMSYALTGIDYMYNSATLRHAQFLHCSNSVLSGVSVTINLVFENVLFYDVARAFNGNVSLHGYHLTVHQCSQFSTIYDDEYWTYFYNSLFVRVTNWGNAHITLTSCQTNFDDSTFQTVGAGAHYLATNSPVRNAGTSAGLSAELLGDLKRRTTYPPIVISSVVQSNSLLLSAQAARDIDVPDLGYHYDPLDFAFGAVTLSNAALSLLPGTAIASFSPTGGAWALELRSGANIQGEGSPTNLIRIVRYNTVQEQANTNWTPRGSFLVTGGQTGAPCPVTFRFTEWACLALDHWHWAGFDTTNGAIRLTDCQFHGGSISSGRVSLGYTNCLFSRVNQYLDDFGDFEDFQFDSRNTTYLGGGLEIFHWNSANWSFTNNLFDGTYSSPDGTLAANYNGYTTNLTIFGTGTNNVLLATDTVAFEQGSLGYFYLQTNGPPTNLVNKGSQNATNAGLWHFTTRADQIKETNTIVDIGFHYVAVGTNGLPVDTDGDGWPDYWEDANGNGSLDSGETKPNDAADRGLRVFITRPRSGSTIP